MVNETSSSVDNSSRPPRIVFLALIMLISCAGNVFLLHASVQMRKACYNVQSITIMILVVVCLVDCLLNMTLVMGSLAAGEDWAFSDGVCRWHTFVMNLVLIETTLLLAVLACDRFLAVKFPHKYDSLLSPVRLGIVISVTWVQSLAFSVPFLFDVVNMTFRQKLHTCSVSEQTPLSFICLASVLCFLAPAVIIIVMFVLVFHINYRHKHEVKTIITQNHYTDQLMEEPRFWREMQSVKYVGVLCLMWFILEIPYVIITYIQQYRLSTELNFSVSYPWGVDVGFMWMRFAFSAVMPCVTFIWKKDMWQYCKECVICHRSNSVLDIQVKVNPSKAHAAKDPPPAATPPRTKDREPPRPEPPSLLSFNVPVLFATSAGIHIETPHDEPEESDSAAGESGEQILKGRQLDVGDHSVPKTDITWDTSDYDSSFEAGYLSSQPLSARHIRGCLEASSSPDLQADGQNERGTLSTAVEISTTQGADSGVDLSGTSTITSLKIDKSEIMQVRDDVNEDRCNAAAIPGFYPGSDDQEHKDHCHTDGTDNPTCNGSASVVADNTESVVVDKEDAAACEHPPPAPPKVRGRLKPLNSDKKIKPKRDASKKSRRNAMPQDSGKGGRGDGDNSTKESSARSHKRTSTSDSEKALLGSNSSAEMQNLKSDKLQANPERGS